MTLPKKIAPQTLGGLQLSDPFNYETHRQVITAHNNLIEALGPGVDIKPSDFALSPGLGAGASITAVSGTFKRGRFTFSVGSSGFVANPTLTLAFPGGLFNSNPFAIVTRNGGTGVIPFTYVESVNGITISFVGTLAGGTTYIFQFAVRD